MSTPQRRKCLRCGRNRAVKFYRPRGRVCVTCQKTTRTKQNRALHLRKTYDLSVEQYEAMLESQDHRCAICRRRAVTKNLHVDHDHATGEVRGLLCKPCNYRFLPVVEHHPDWVANATQYLDYPPARHVL